MSYIVTSKQEPLPSVPFPQVIDSSMLGSYKSCSRQFYYQYLRHLRSTEQSIHLVAGGALADGLEKVRTAIWGPEKHSFEHAIHLGRVAAIKAKGEYEPPEGHNKNLANVLLAIEEYFLHHGTHTDHIQPFMRRDSQGVERPAVEFSFAMPTGIPHPETGEDILYVGRFDMFGERTIGGSKNLFVVDEKTTTSLGPQWAKNWDLRSQFTGYCWAAQEYGYPVSGAIVRGISFLKSDFGFADVITYRKAFEINQWKAATRKYILRLIEDWQRLDFEHQLDSACTSYGGCPYQMLCKTPNPERFIPANYVVSEWKPMEAQD